MTGFAAGSRIIFLIEIRIMNILMTIGAMYTNILKTPFFRFFMTFETRSGQMSSIQWEITGIMLLCREIKTIEALGSVTRGTILNNGLLYKLAFVIIGMAIGAMVIFQVIGEVGFMAGFTGDILMLIFQLVICLGMVKIGESLNGVKGNFIMALSAVLTELILVNIRMAACAVFEFYTGKLLESCAVFQSKGMTLYAWHSLV